MTLSVLSARIEQASTKMREIDHRISVMATAAAAATIAHRSVTSTAEA